MEEVEQVIEEYVIEQEELPTTSNVVERTELSDFQVRQSLELLEGNSRVQAAHRSRGNPTVWVPGQMWEALLNHREQPRWLEQYGLERRRHLDDAIRKKREELSQLRRIEELLYTGGRTLEEAVHAALMTLEVENLSADFDKSDLWDFSFVLDGVFIIAEGKGKSGPADKEDVQQLEGWMNKYMEENPDAEPEELCGLLVINHYRNLEPSERWPAESSKPPLTAHAEKFLRLRGRRRFITTVDLYELTPKVVNGEIDPAEARRKLEEKMRKRVNDE